MVWKSAKIMTNAEFTISDFLTVRNGNRVVINNEESIFRNQGDIPTESI